MLHRNISNVEFVTADAFLFDTQPFDVIVNPSTEHMDPDHLQFSFANIEPKKLCIFQNNDMAFVEDHINCFSTSSKFQTYLEEQFEVVNMVETTLDNGYKRYTAVCYKL
jgi:hypothetical protein